MQYATFAVNSTFDNGKKLVVQLLVFFESGVCYKVGQLRQARSTGVYKKRHLCQVSDDTPRMPDGAKVSGEILNRGFVSGFVKNDDASLRITIAVQPHQKVVEAARQLLESQLHRVFGRCQRFFDGADKNTVGFVGFGKDLKRIFYRLDAVGFGKLPPKLSASKHGVAVQFDRSWVGWVETGSDFVQLAGNPECPVFQKGKRLPK